MVEKLWEASQDRKQKSSLFHFMEHVNRTLAKDFRSYNDLYQWSITETGAFWQQLEQFVGLVWRTPYSESYTPPPATKMLGARWFEGGRLNYAENLLAGLANDRIVLRGYREGVAAETKFTGRELRKFVAASMASLQSLGVKPGDRVVGVCSNTCETIIAMLAVTGLGGVWASCSPDFGVEGILDRFSQIAPKVLFFSPSYNYAGKTFSLAKIIPEVVRRLPSCSRAIAIADDSQLEGTLPWEDFLNLGGLDVKANGKMQFADCSFSDPLFILFSSGTTGIPKCIIHSVGGTLLQHKKELMLHCDVNPHDTLLYFTTCGWMMWNWMVLGLSAGATLALYDGSVNFPSENQLWTYVEQAKVTVFGTSPKYIGFCMKDKIKPMGSCLRTILATGSPLLDEHFRWIYEHVPNVHLASISGGTDIISCFMLGNPLLPVYAGEIQGPGLGMAIAAWDDSGQPIFGEKGELVCTKAFPSMPIGFWNDPTGVNYQRAYFGFYSDQQVWRHGDFVAINPSTGGVVVYGRSDATLNPGGVRIGTAEIYRSVEEMPDLADSIVAARSVEGDVEVWLFVVLSGERVLDQALEKRIKAKIRMDLTPRHVPEHIVQVIEVPYTRSGKKVELAVSAVLNGLEVKNIGAISNAICLKNFAEVIQNRMLETAPKK